MTEVIVVGAGPAGAVAALRAGELGARTVLLARDEFGGEGAWPGNMATASHFVPVRSERSTVNAGTPG
jgi:pyruvate/2-oxoglutarate dehydrogenase complex dihydrolipoamide dehydrogenase (E3) component